MSDNDKDNENIEETTTEEIPDEIQPTYRDHITNLLNRVSRGEEIYKKDEINPIHQTIKDHGVKGALVRVFNEDIEPGNYQLNEDEDPESQKIEDSDFYKVNLPSSYPNAKTYWEKLTPLLRNIGDANINPEGNSVHTIQNSGEGKDILSIQLVRNSESSDKPSIYMKWQDTEEPLTDEEAKAILKSVGIGAENAIMLNTGTVVEAEP